MNKIVTTIAALGGVALFAGNAMAASDSYCRNYANQQVNRYANPVGAAAGGCIVGGVLGSLLSNGNGGAIAGGCVAGGAGGLVLTDQKRNEIFQQAYWSCRNNGAGPGPQPQPIYAPSIPAGSALVKQTANMRSSPEVNPYNVVGSLPGGSIVAVTSCNGYGWCAVAPGNGMSAWVSQSLLRFGG
jgi:hypothetical protein